MSGRGWLAVAWVLVILLLSFHDRLLTVRTPEHGDQDAYLELAANIRDGRGFVTDGLSPFSPSPAITHPESVRAPLYPLLLAPVATREPGAFDRAKRLTLAVSLAVLLCAFLMLRRSDGPWVAGIFSILLAQNAAFETHATELWAENLLLLWALPAYLLLRRGFRRDALPERSAMAAGGLLGLGYLTKTSVTLLLAAAVAVLLLYRPRWWGAATRLVLLFVLAIAPYLAVNVVNTGSLTRDVDLRGAFWIERGQDYWLVHESRPSLFSYVRDHGWTDIVRRLATGVWAQGPNLVDAVALKVPEGKLLGVSLLFLAMIGFSVEPSSRWRGFQLLVFGLNLLVAGWYATIDTAPRFLYLLVPLVYLNAANGAVVLVLRMREMSGCSWRVGNRDDRGPLLAFLLVSILHLHDVSRIVMPSGGPGALMRPWEAETVDAVRRLVAEDEVIAIGPTHALPFQWLMARKRVFVPDYPEWEQVSGFFDEYGARWLLLDPQMVLRRPGLFADRVDLHPVRGLFPGDDIPGFRLVFRNSSGPSLFLIYRRTP